MDTLTFIFINQPLDQFELFVLNELTQKYFLDDALICYLLENNALFFNLFRYLVYMVLIVTILFNIIIVNKIEIF